MNKKQIENQKKVSKIKTYKKEYINLKVAMLLFCFSN